MKNTKRIALSLFLIVSLLLSCMHTISADALNGEENVSLNIIYTYDSDILNDVVFKIYYVASVNSGANFTLDGSFKNCPVDVNLGSTDYPALAHTIYGYVQLDNIAPTYTVKTDSKGEIMLTTSKDGLKHGMYLVTAEKVERNFKEYSMLPYLVCTPRFNDEWLRFDKDVKSYPKVRCEELEIPDDPDDTSSSSSSSESTSSDESIPPSSSSTVSSESMPSSSTVSSETTPPSSTVSSEITPPSSTVSSEITPSSSTPTSSVPISSTPQDESSSSESSSSEITPSSSTPTSSVPISSTPQDESSSSESSSSESTSSSNTSSQFESSSRITSSSHIESSSSSDTSSQGELIDVGTVITVKKKWADPDDPDRPDSVTIYLLKDGKKYDTITLSDSNKWIHKWSNLDEKHEWLAVEEPIEGYTVLVTDEKTPNAYTVTNTKTPERITDSDIESDSDPDKPTPPLPQTGTLWWAVLATLTPGLVLYWAGYVMKKRNNKND